MIAAVAALCYWFPKITGKMLNERIGKVAFWFIAIAIQITYFGQFWEGFQGMPRRVAFYDPTFLRANQVTSVGGYLLMFGFLLFLYCLINGWTHGTPAPANPWHAKSLEWKVPTPVPLANFLVDPVVTSDPYGFGEPEPDGVEVEIPDPDRELVPTLSSDRPVTGGEVL
jgi:cytochrome c oxidase subunit 1